MTWVYSLQHLFVFCADFQTFHHVTLHTHQSGDWVRAGFPYKTASEIVIFIIKRKLWSSNSIERLQVKQVQMIFKGLSTHFLLTQLNLKQTPNSSLESSVLCYIDLQSSWLCILWSHINFRAYLRCKSLWTKWEYFKLKKVLFTHVDIIWFYISLRHCRFYTVSIYCSQFGFT